MNCKIDNNNKIFSRPDVIISLTSYPARINTINQVVESLLNQSFKADKIILWLAPEQFPNKERDLPKQLLDLKDKGLTIDWYHDIKSYKKLIPALIKYSNAIIVTADDDLIYPKDWLKILYESYECNPNNIHCHRAHRVLFDRKNNILPYNQWMMEIKTKKASFNNFLTGIGGVLYPQNCLYRDILKENLFMNLCPTNDDIWFWAMCVMNNRKISIVKSNYSYSSLCIEGTQEDALYKTNVLENKNDEQINRILKYYPKILEKTLSQNNRIENILLKIKIKIKKNFGRLVNKYLL